MIETLNDFLIIDFVILFWKRYDINFFLNSKSKLYKITKRFKHKNGKRINKTNILQPIEISSKLTFFGDTTNRPYCQHNIIIRSSITKNRVTNTNYYTQIAIIKNHKTY